MNALDQPPSMAPAIPWPERCLEHASREVAFWTRVLNVLSPMHRALSMGQWNALVDATQAQDALAQESDRLRTARHGLRDEIGAALSVPAAMLTLTEIARHMAPSAGQRLRTLRDQLKAKTDEVQRLSQVCARLAQFHLDFVQRFFVDLTGAGDGSRYGPSGTLRPAACRPLIQARG